MGETVFACKSQSPVQKNWAPWPPRPEILTFGSAGGTFCQVLKWSWAPRVFVRFGEVCDFGQVPPVEKMISKNPGMWHTDVGLWVMISRTMRLSLRCSSMLISQWHLKAAPVTLYIYIYIPAPSNRCFLVTTGAQKPLVRVSKQPVGGCWYIQVSSRWGSMTCDLLEGWTALSVAPRRPAGPTDPRRGHRRRRGGRKHRGCGRCGGWGCGDGCAPDMGSRGGRWMSGKLRGRGRSGILLHIPTQKLEMVRWVDGVRGKSEVICRQDGGVGFTGHHLRLLSLQKPLGRRLVGLW